MVQTNAVTLVDSGRNGQFASCSLVKKQRSSKDGITAQSCCSGHDSKHGCNSKTAAVSNESISSECTDEVEIEIPGGFDNINSFDNGLSSHGDDSSEYVRFPKLDKWIGLDWDEVSITSDVS